MFTFMGMVGERLLYQRILSPEKAKIFVVELEYNSMMLMGFISKRIFEDILSLVLQNRFADREPMSDPQNEALFEILNPEDVFAIIPTSTCHGKSIIYQCLPDLCRELFLRRFPYPSNAVVVVVVSYSRTTHSRDNSKMS